MKLVLITFVLAVSVLTWQDYRMDKQEAADQKARMDFYCATPQAIETLCKGRM